MVGQILDTLAGSYGLRYAFDSGIHAVSGNLLYRTICALIFKAGIEKGLYFTVDGEVGQLRSTIEDVDLAQRFFLRGGGLSHARKEAENHHEDKQ